MEKDSSDEVHLRLEGKAALVRDGCRFTYRYEPSFSGIFRYDRIRQTLTQVDIVAVGEWTWDYRPGSPKEVLGVALELWQGSFASPFYDRYFPGSRLRQSGYRQEGE